MDINDIVDNVVSSISGDSDYQTWVNGIWSGVTPSAAKVDDEVAALELPAGDTLPDSRVFSTPLEPDHVGQDEIYAYLPIVVITWMKEESGRDLADDLRSVQDYIIKAIMSDDYRGGYAIFTDIIYPDEPNTEDDPLGYIRLEIQVYYQIKEAS